ncbi:hypothetical protein PHYBOEH_008800 [Phytophthora boehmeriae]|uniref:C3H1-type domain-containing protein n=1 Tax=Phytophthora boehmeriae TaxID=109152 RepID=A0A8T1VXW2_9STRA|nr:hypothetical protein PHYBOEH_008800 [Phytophthora boehmeriae]
MKTHVVCSDCDFSASKRVVTAHFQTAHGQYAGHGLKEVDVEGQKFMVLVGNSAEDIARWRAERRKKWPGTSTSQQPQPSTSIPPAKATTENASSETKKRKLSISSEEDLEDGEIEEDEEAKAQQLAKLQAMIPPTAPTSSDQPPLKKPRKMLLCKWLVRGHCRFNADNCRYSHDRSAFPCRSMMHKGSCAKGAHCHFSHDPEVLSGQRDRAQAALAERATEQQWRGEQRSLLRKLLAKDVRVEQRKMLQIVQFLVANDFLRSSNGEVAETMEIAEPVLKTDVSEMGDVNTVVAGSTQESNEIMPSDEIEIKTEVSPSDDVNMIATASAKDITDVTPSSEIELKTEMIRADETNTLATISTKEPSRPSNETELKTEVSATNGVNTVAPPDTKEPIQVVPSNETELTTEVFTSNEVGAICATSTKESIEVVPATDKEAVEEKKGLNDAEAKPTILEEPKPEVEN